MRTLLKDVIGPSATAVATRVFSDNKSALALARDNTYHSRTKHIDIRYHFIHDQVERKIIALEYRKTDDNAADIFTKPVACMWLKHLAQLVGIRAL